jgi:hypothetical protein
MDIIDTNCLDAYIVKYSRSTAGNRQVDIIKVFVLISLELFWEYVVKLKENHNILIVVIFITTTCIYCTLRFYFPYLSLLAQPVTIFVYGPARYLHYYFR